MTTESPADADASTPAPSANTPRRKRYSRPRPRCITAQPSRNPDTAIGCIGAEGPGLIRNGAPYVDMVVGTGQLARCRSWSPQVPRDRAARYARSALAALRRRHEKSTRVSATTLPRPSMRPTPFQALRPHPDRLRQVLHLLRRLTTPRAGAEPARRTICVAEVHASCVDQGVQGSHARSARP